MLIKILIDRFLKDIFFVLFYFLFQGETAGGIRLELGLELVCLINFALINYFSIDSSKIIN